MYMPPLSEASHRRAKEILDGFSRVGEVMPGSHFRVSRRELQSYDESYESLWRWISMNGYESNNWGIQNSHKTGESRCHHRWTTSWIREPSRM